MDTRSAGGWVSEVRLVRRLAAEFGVIVLGVMVALGADRWIQARDERGREADYLARIEAELVRDSAMLAGHRDASAQASATSRQLLLWIDGEPISDTIDAGAWVRDLVTTSWYGPFEPARATWNELLQTGNLRLLADPEVREALGAWEEMVEIVDGWEEDWEPNALEFQTALRVALPPLVHIEALRSFDVRGMVAAGEEVELMAGVDLPEATAGDLQRVVDRFRSNDEALSSLSQLHIVHWARGNVYGNEAVTQAALLEALNAVRNARESLP